MKIENIVNIDIQCQTLKFTEFSYPISSAKNGLGEKENSFKTPRGKFKIYKKIGENAIKNTIFIGRKATNIWDKKLTNKDLILSRILWLEGLEESNKNTKNRYIYIHGTNHEKYIGKPHSLGCIRMKNNDIIRFFSQIEVGTIVNIC